MHTNSKDYRRKCPQPRTSLFSPPFHPNHPRFATRPPAEVATPEIIDGEVEWEVEAVTDFRQFRNGTRRYKVKWVGAQKEQWLGESEMKHCPAAIRQYFTTNNLPIPTAVSQFCTTAEAEEPTEDEETETGESQKAFVWESLTEDED